MPRTKLTGTVQNDVLKEYVARGTYIYPAGAVAPAGRGHLPLRRRRGDELQPDLDQRLPHAGGGGDGGAGGGVHPRQRAGVRARGGGGRAGGGRLRPPALVLLREPQRSLRGGGEVPRGAAALGPAGARALRRRRRDRAAPLPHPDRRRHAPGAAAAQQRGAGDGAGARGGAGRHPVAAHQRLRRGAGAPDRASRPRWRSAPSRSSATRAAWRTWWIRWRAATTSSRSPTRSRRARAR